MIYRYVAAALDFSKATGIDVYDTWGLTNHAQIQDTIRPVAKDYNQPFVDKLYHQLDLPKARTPFERYHAVMGAVSQYNRDDIEYFMHVPTGRRDPHDKIREAVIEYKTGTSLYWVLSPKTLDKIERTISIGQFQSPLRRDGYQYSMGRTSPNHEATANQIS